MGIENEVIQRRQQQLIVLSRKAKICCKTTNSGLRKPSSAIIIAIYSLQHDLAKIETLLSESAPL